MANDPEAVVHWAIGTLARSEPHALAPSLRLKEDLGIDSLEFVELVQLIEQKLGVQLSDDAVASVRDVGALVRAVENSLREAGTAPR